MIEVNGVRGFLADADCRWLYGQGRLQPEAAQCLEVGSMFGLSASLFASGLRDAGNEMARLYCIDTWQGSPEHAGMPEIASGVAFDLFAANINRLGLSDLVVAVRGKSPEAAAQFADESLDWVFIDGAHDEASVRADMLGWWRKIKPGGALCGHDAVPGCEVLPVVLEFSARWGIEIVPRTQGIWVAKKEAPE